MGPQSRAQPKNGTKTGFKIGPKSRPQNAIPGRQLCRKTQTRFSINQSVVCSAIFFNCLQQTKNFNQRRNRNLGRQIRSNKEHVYVYRPNIVKTWPPFRRYTVQFHTWENQQQHACYSTITMENAWKCCGKWTFIVLLCWFTHENGVIFHRHVGLPEGKFGIHECQWCDQQKNSCDVIFGEFFWICLARLLWPIDQWPFQDPKLEVPTIYKAYVRPM